jgi:hypothetical protein
VGCALQEGDLGIENYKWYIVEILILYYPFASPFYKPSQYLRHSEAIHLRQIPLKRFVESKYGTMDIPKLS